MRCLFFTSGMTRGGAERVIATISNCLVEAGHSVAIAMLKGTVSEYQLDGRVKLIAGNLQPGYKNAAKALEFYVDAVEGFRPDAVLSFTAKPNLIACVARLLGKVDVCLLVSERADPLSRRKYVQGLYNRVYRIADCCICQSSRIASYYKERLGRCPVEVIENPLDVASIPNKLSDINGNYIFTAGRLCEQKRQDLAIKAFSLIADEYPEFSLKICGVGDCLEQLQSLSDSLACGNRVVFEGSVPNVMKKYSDAAAFIFTSEFEGFPNALIEAVASGFPVITTDFSPGIASSIVVDGENGYVVPCGDVLAIASAIRKVIDGSIDRRYLMRCSEGVRERFSTELIADKWINVIHKLKEGVDG